MRRSCFGFLLLILVVWVSGGCRRNRAVDLAWLQIEAGFQSKKPFLLKPVGRDGATVEISIKETKSNVVAIPLQKKMPYRVVYEDEGSLLVMLCPGDTVRVNIKDKNFQHIFISGGEENESFLSFHRVRVDVEKQQKNLMEQLYQSTSDKTYGSFRKKAQEKQKAIRAEFRQQVSELIKRHPRRLANMVMLSYPFGSSLLFQPTEDYVLFQQVDSLLVSEYADHELVNNFHHYVSDAFQNIAERNSRASLLRVGDPLPDLIFENAGGRMVSLHELARAKTLLYFYSFADDGFKDHVLHLKRLDDTFPDVYVVAVALHENRKLWQKLVVNSRFADKHLIEVQGKDAPALQGLRIDSLPVGYLIDEKARLLSEPVKGPNIYSQVRDILLPE